MAKLSRSDTTLVLKQVNSLTRKKSPITRVVIAIVVLGLLWAITNLNPQLGTNNQTVPTPTPTVVSSPTPTSSATPIAAGSYLVERVVDGDTIVVITNGQSQTVRLIGIDTPEVVDPRKPVQCFGQEASSKLKELLVSQTVKLESDPTQDAVDVYGRWLRYVYLEDGTNVNLLMIQQGFANEYTFRIPYLQQTQFKQAQQQARQQELGLWSPTTCSGRK